MLRPLVRIPNIQTKKGVNTREKQGPYQLEKKTINELLEAFGHVYPYLNQELERLRTYMPTGINAFQPSKVGISGSVQATNNLVRNSQVR